MKLKEMEPMRDYMSLVTGATRRFPQIINIVTLSGDALHYYVKIYETLLIEKIFCVFSRYPWFVLDARRCLEF